MDERSRAASLARQIGTRIPCDILATYWALPILERIVQILDEKDIINQFLQAPHRTHLVIWQQFQRRIL